MNTQRQAYKALKVLPDLTTAPKISRRSFGSRLDQLWQSFTRRDQQRGWKTIAPALFCSHRVSVIIHRLTAVDPWDQPFDSRSDFCIWLNINNSLGGVVGLSSDNTQPDWQSNQITLKNPQPNYIAPIVINVIRTSDASDANSVDMAETQRIELSYNLETGLVRGSGIIGRQGQPIFHVSSLEPDNHFHRIGIWFSVHHQL